MTPTQRISAKCREVESGCWEWTGCRDKDGYGKISINGKGDRAHRVSYEAHRGPIPAGRFVLHHCDNPPCVNPDHIYVGDQIQNEADKRNRNRGPAGERNVKAKLTTEQVSKIRVLLEQGISGSQIGRIYGVSKTAISRIKLDKTWQQDAS